MPTHTRKNELPQGTIRLEPPTAVSGDIVPANFFTFSWSGGVEVQMDVGFVDLGTIARVSRGAKESVTPEVSHRVFMSVRGFAMLLKAANQAGEKLKAQGVPLDDMAPGLEDRE